MKTRWAYTIANRDKLTYQQEINYGLKPIDFPYNRFNKYKLLVHTDTFKISQLCNLQLPPGLMVASYMYTFHDTVPVYKDSSYIEMVTDYTTAYQTYEEMNLQNLGWINIDKFYNEPLCDSTTFTLNIKLENCKIYYKVLDVNSVLSETKSNIAGVHFSAIQKLPLGKKIEIIILGIKENAFFNARKTIVVNKRNEIFLDVTPLEEKDA
jgi:hypothetical protein